MNKLLFYFFLIQISVQRCYSAATRTPTRYCMDFVGSGARIDQPLDDSDENNDDSDYETYEEVPVYNTNATEPTKIACSSNSNYCYTVWKTSRNGTFTVIKQGCWSDKEQHCNNSQCVDVTKPTNFCCCSEDYCNVNYTIAEPTAESVLFPPNQSSLPISDSIFTYPVVWVGLIAALVVFVSVTLFLTCHTSQKSEPELAPLSPSGPGYSSNLQNVDNLKLCAMIGQGRYGTVWKGMVNEQPVAVKIFSSHHKQYFINEREIYSQPLMDSLSLLSYFGCDERRTMDDNIEYLLVLSLAPLGCLQDWLVENTTSFTVFCNMAKTLTRGLSHLHTELRKGDLYKACIAHRDLNSRNVLVKSDLSCCIGDFGFALKTFGPRYEYRGEMTLAETKSINEVGTLRYMAPEILEGAVNLRDCESALKQIDIYSLGLVVWELCTRCHDLYPVGQICPEYKAPYELEVGKHPSFEQMQVLVSRHKARPLFPPGWGGGSASKVAKDTCEDCWDHDAEARLTALCVEERLHEMSNLRPRSHSSRGPSPPISTNNLTVITPSSSPCMNIVAIPPNQNIQNNNNGDLSQSDVPIKNREMFSNQIQSFQGRNPCLERNLAPINNQTQVLIDKSHKHSFLSSRERDENGMSLLEGDVNVDDLINGSRINILTTQNIMGEGFPKQNNTDKKLKGWHGVRALIQKKLFKKNQNLDFNQENEEKSNLVDEVISTPSRIIRVNLDNTKNQNGQIHSMIEPIPRPSNLDLAPLTIKYTFANDLESKFRRLPGDKTDQTFTILNSIKNQNQSPRIVVSKSANAVKNLIQVETLNEKQIKRQRSLEIFNEVFGTKGSSERLRDISQRVKTPGDVPPSVRKVRASKTLSLYDDRMMDSSIGNTL